jgi:succinate dehydrogenase / fumarate reductase flavoprotein subunit
MAEIHAKQSPERILELERYGAVFDRTKNGEISQRNFGGHEYPRLAHVGDRTGLEMIRTLQDVVVHLEKVTIHMEVTITHLLKAEGRIAGAVGYKREDGVLQRYNARAVIMATGGVGKSYKITSNSWEYTGDGHSMAYEIGAELVDMEFIQFHPTGMVYPSSVKGVLVTEGVRGEGGILTNSKGERFMFNYIPEMFQGEYAETEEEATAWLEDNDAGRRPPELLTRDVVAKAILAEVKAGRGTPHGGAYLDIATPRGPDYIKKKLPSMYHQFKTLANLDITQEPMEVGPTTHYIMGGIRVDPETQSSNISGLYAAGEVAGGLHGANRLGGNSLSDLVVFGKLAGEFAAKYARENQPVQVDEAQLKTIIGEILAPFDDGRDENPYVIHRELQEVMGEYVGIIRTENKLAEGIKILEKLLDRAAKAGTKGGRRYNPGWHEVLDLKSMIKSSIILAYAAKQRKESRGAHTRDDYPKTEKDLTHVLYIIKKGENGEVLIGEEEMEPMPPELQQIIDEGGN